MDVWESGAVILGQIVLGSCGGALVRAHRPRGPSNTQLLLIEPPIRMTSFSQSIKEPVWESRKAGLGIERGA
jgi:hypothetical protein